jgi:hypothetical protein
MFCNCLFMIILKADDIRSKENRNEFQKQLAASFRLSLVLHASDRADEGATIFRNVDELLPDYMTIYYTRSSLQLLNLTCLVNTLYIF